MHSRVVAAAAVLVFGLAPAVPAQATLSVTVTGNPRDARVEAVRDAVAFWNRPLQQLAVVSGWGPFA